MKIALIKIIIFLGQSKKVIISPLIKFVSKTSLGSSPIWAGFSGSKGFFLMAFSSFKADFISGGWTMAGLTRLGISTRFILGGLGFGRLASAAFIILSNLLKKLSLNPSAATGLFSTVGRTAGVGFFRASQVRPSDLAETSLTTGCWAKDGRTACWAGLSSTAALPAK